MSIRYLTPTSLDRMSMRVGPLCTSLINTLLNLARSRHKHTLPLLFGTRTMLLYHSDVLSTSNSKIIFCSYNLSSSSLSGCFSTYATLLGGAKDGWPPSLTFSLNMSSKHPIPVKTPLNSL